MSDKIHEAHRLVEEAGRVAGLPALYARFLDNAAEAVVIVDQFGKIAFFNRKATFLFGYPPDEVIGQPVEVLLPESLKSVHAEIHRKGFMRDPYSRAMGANLDLKARRKDGTEFPVVIDLHPEMGSDGAYVRAAIRRKDSPEGPPSDALLIADAVRNALGSDSLGILTRAKQPEPKK
jgi:PAS domain S-box-containing protein